MARATLQRPDQDAAAQSNSTRTDPQGPGPSRKASGLEEAGSLFFGALSEFSARLAMTERASKRQRSEAVVSARVPIATLDALREQARREDRTLSGQVRRVLRAWHAQSDPRAGAATAIAANGISE